MQLDLPLRPGCGDRHYGVLRCGRRTLLLRIVRHRRARRYILRVREDGVPEVTLPPGGSRRSALEFARQHVVWIDRQRYLNIKKRPSRRWIAGTQILLRGGITSLQLVQTDDGQAVTCDTELIPVPAGCSDIRPAVERHLWRAAGREIVPRVLELATCHGLTVKSVKIGNQRSRWGSCSSSGVIALNWRLIQMPRHVRDYVILHELMHLREANHSSRFWAQLGRVCPAYADARRWLLQYGSDLW